jgi:predicted ribosome quality control (RQC) complex YloA/Tae2 family protein
MKTENIFIQNLHCEISFYIGQNKVENYKLLDIEELDDTDLWFHAKDESSCHVIAKIPEYTKNTKNYKKDKKYIIKMGALLCKKYTNKLKNIKKVNIIYTQIKYIEKTNIMGCVNIKNEKCINI